MNTAPDIDWNALARLRDAFLRGTAGQEDYWRSESDLASYDATFAQRIGWKWDHVLEDLTYRGWSPPHGEWVDWGCGTGIAARACLDHFGVAAATAIRFVDRSPAAMSFAAHRARTRFPQFPVTTGAPTVLGPSNTVLLSHLLSELDPSQIEQLLARIGDAGAILWVEPGTYESSLALIAVRERLLGRFHLVAPCCHNARCGILTPGNEPHWCHHFASPPPGVFTDPFWGRFAHLLGIDLRSLPLSYLILSQTPPSPLPPDTVRTLGRPRVLKGCLRVLACDATGVSDAPLEKRHNPELYRAAKKDRFPSLQLWNRQGPHILAAPMPESPPSPPPNGIGA